MEEEKNTADINTAQWNSLVHSILAKHNISPSANPEDDIVLPLNASDEDKKTLEEGIDKLHASGKDIVEQPSSPSKIGMKCPANHSVSMKGLPTTPEHDDDDFDVTAEGEEEEKEGEDRASILEITVEEVENLQKKYLWESFEKAAKNFESFDKEKLKEYYIVFRRVFIFIMLETYKSLDGLPNDDDDCEDALARAARAEFSKFIEAFPECPLRKMMIEIMNKVKSRDNNEGLGLTHVNISQTTENSPKTLKTADCVTAQIMTPGKPCHCAIVTTSGGPMNFVWESTSYDEYVKYIMKKIAVYTNPISYVMKCVEDFTKAYENMLAERRKKVALVSSEGTQFIANSFVQMMKVMTVW